MKYRITKTTIDFTDDQYYGLTYRNPRDSTEGAIAELIAGDSPPLEIPIDLWTIGRHLPPDPHQHQRALDAWWDRNRGSR